jgi:hypothetical protein
VSAKTRTTGAPTRGHFHVLFDVVDALPADGSVGGGEVVAHARAADADAEVGGLALEAVDVAVWRHGGIAGEVVTRRIEALELIPGGEIEKLHQGDAFPAAADLIVQQLVERVRVERNLEGCAFRGERQAGERDKRQALEEVSAIHVGFHFICSFGAT